MRIAIVAAVLLAALAIPAALLLGRSRETVDFRGSEPPDGLMLPAFELRDDEGRLVRSTELRGKSLAVTFLDAQCVDACPIIAAQIASAMRVLGDRRSEVEAIAISADPVRDTPAQIDGFLRRHRAKGALRYLDGTVGELRPVWKGFAVAVSHDTGTSNMHSAPVRVYDADGRWRSTLHAGVDLTATNLAHDLRTALTAS